MPRSECDASHFLPLRSSARQRPAWLGRECTASGSSTRTPLNAANLDLLCSRAASRASVAAWGRLTLHFLKLSVLRRASEQPSPRTPAFVCVGPALRAHALAATLSEPHGTLDVDGTLGFPGEGPLRRGPQESSAERARRRAGVGELPEGRPVGPATDSSRKRLFAATGPFEFPHSPLDPSALNNLLADYGRFLWRSGHVYWKYSETLNAVTAKRREFRPLLGRAWDVAWTWRTVEHIGHNFAFP